jgi:hypothetical protein
MLKNNMDAQKNAKIATNDFFQPTLLLCNAVFL